MFDNSIASIIVTMIPEYLRPNCVARCDQNPTPTQTSNTAQIRKSASAGMIGNFKRLSPGRRFGRLVSCCYCVRANNSPGVAQPISATRTIFPPARTDAYNASMTCMFAAASVAA